MNTAQIIERAWQLYCPVCGAAPHARCGAQATDLHPERQETARLMAGGGFRRDLPPYTVCDTYEANHEEAAEARGEYDPEYRGEEVRLEHDYTLEYTAGNGAESRCRVRIYAPDDEQDAPVVIFSETPDNTGQSVTNAAEVIAGTLLQRHGLAAGTASVFIEHYPPESEPIRHPAIAGQRPLLGESFDLVTFAGPLTHRRIWGGSECWIALLGKPEWRPLEKAQVERLIGRSLEPTG